MREYCWQQTKNWRKSSRVNRKWRQSQSGSEEENEATAAAAAKGIPRSILFVKRDCAKREGLTGVYEGNTGDEPERTPNCSIRQRKGTNSRTKKSDDQEREAKILVNIAVATALCVFRLCLLFDPDPREREEWETQNKTSRQGNETWGGSYTALETVSAPGERRQRFRQRANLDTGNFIPKVFDTSDWK